MPAKKKTGTAAAHSPTSTEVPKSAKPKRLEDGDWVMLESPLFIFLHKMDGGRSKQNIKTLCGLVTSPDMSGRKPGPRCKVCISLSAVS